MNEELRVAKEKLERTNRYYTILNKINHAIIRIRNREELYREACRIVVEDGLFKMAWVADINEEDESTDIKSSFGFTNEEFNLISGILKEYKEDGSIAIQAIKNKDYKACYNIKEEAKSFKWYDFAMTSDLKSCAAFALAIDGRVFGVMMFYSTEYSFYEDKEIELLKALCDNISFAVNSIEQEDLRKKAEEELRLSEERYRKIVEFSPTAIWVTEDNKIKLANVATAKLLGFNNPEELVGRNILNFIHEDYHDIANKRFKEVLNDNKTVPFIEERFIKKDGSLIDVEVSSTNFPHIGQNTTLAVAKDITEKKRMKEFKKTAEENSRLLNEALEYDKLRTEFFANISHELRTPINVIFSSLQLLNLYTQKDLNENAYKFNKYINVMKQNCYRLLRLVSNIIDITKIDSGFFELKLENHNIVTIVENISLSVAEYIENKGINLIFDTEIEEKIMACDPEKIERIILNLLSNSVKFTKSGGNIEVNIYDRDNFIIISVKDDGIGIPKNKIDVIFERFQQVDKTLTRAHEGSGIGLSLVESLVKMHRGNIKVKSEVGKGSEFIIELPLTLVDKNYCEYTGEGKKENIEKINIEFSDIYS